MSVTTAGGATPGQRYIDHALLILAVTVALALVGFGLAGRALRPATAPPHLVSMEESALAMQQAGTAMQTYGRAIVEQGQQANDPTVIAYGERWQRDGQALVQRGQWMAMNPTAPSNLHAGQAELQTQGNWTTLNRAAQAMLHDPSKARATDIEALRWNGEAMRAEGRTMAEHGQLMADEVELLVSRRVLNEQAARDLRQAARTLRTVGEQLQRNGQAMIDYADQLRRSLGYR